MNSTRAVARATLRFSLGLLENKRIPLFFDFPSSYLGYGKTNVTMRLDTGLILSILGWHINNMDELLTGKKERCIFEKRFLLFFPFWIALNCLSDQALSDHCHNACRNSAYSGRLSLARVTIEYFFSVSTRTIRVFQKYIILSKNKWENRNTFEIFRNDCASSFLLQNSPLNTNVSQLFFLGIPSLELSTCYV